MRASMESWACLNLDIKQQFKINVTWTAVRLSLWIEFYAVTPAL